MQPSNSEAENLIPEFILLRRWCPSDKSSLSARCDYWRATLYLLNAQEVTQEEDAGATGQFMSIMNIKQLISTDTILKTIEVIGLRYRPTR